MEIQNNVYLPLPHVYEREGRQERAWDIYSRLLRDRIIFIGTQIDSYVTCLLYTSPSPRDPKTSRMPSSA